MISPATIVEDVRLAYSAAADCPTGKHPFPVGRAFAEELGYPPSVLRDMPDSSVEAFAGVSNVSIFAELSTGSRVLDLGCGAGLDTFVAASRVGSDGFVRGADFSESMLRRARESQRSLGTTNVEFVSCSADALPFDDGEFDVAIVNGIFNLNPVRDSIFRELARVVRGEGVVFAAELVLKSVDVEKPVATRENWFA
jgi:arsenite methyltransferase